MNSYSKRILVAAGIGALSGFAFVDCGTDNPSVPVPQNNAPGLASDLGNFNMTCNGQSGSQQKQVPFQQQQQSGCKQQNFQFQQQKITDYDVNLDCNAKKVMVHNKGADQKQQDFPIQSDGKVSGKVQYQQQIQNDGKGNQVCWVQYEVDFNGNAQCGNPSPQPTPTLTPSFSSSISPASNTGKDKLTLTASVAIRQTSTQALQQIGILGPLPLPSITPSASPSPVPSTSPSPSPSPSPSSSPSPSPSVTPSPTPTPIPTPSGTPVVICVVDNPCPIVGSTDISCGQ